MDNGREQQRREIGQHMLAAGWPDFKAYCNIDGITYNDRVRAEDLYQKLFLLITELAVEGDQFDEKRVVLLGAVAKYSVPRAMDLLGLMPLGADGGGTWTAMPSSYSDWPVTAE